MLTADFDYDLPTGAIAQTAIEPRDAARLLVVSTMEDRVFADLPELLRQGDLLVVNRTRVRAARLRGVKPETGGRVEMLLTRRLDRERWEALLRPARRIRAGSRLDFGAIHGTVVSGPTRGVVTVTLSAEHGDVDDVLPSIGEVPLPPYFRGSLPDDERYQTIFAKELGSAAAPTAALHFTGPLIAALAERGVPVTEIDLEVGLDTFRPIAADALGDHEMHRERYHVPEEAAAAVAACRRGGGRVVAVGTTTVRTLESAADDRGAIDAGPGETGLFITPGYSARVVDAVITNFHAPRTTVIVMAAAFIGPRWRDVYRTALERGYRFLSFGDAMLVEGLRT